MLRILRLTSVVLFATLAIATFQTASAQMMHYALDITIETEDGSPIPAGTVCVTGEVGDICQDIPADTPSGRDFYFEGLADGEHTITVNAGDYLEAIDYADAADPATEVTIVLYMEETPTDLPNTGAGVTATATDVLAPTLAGLAGVLLLGATATYLVRRPVR